MKGSMLGKEGTTLIMLLLTKPGPGSSEAQMRVLAGFSGSGVN